MVLLFSGDQHLYKITGISLHRICSYRETCVCRRTGQFHASQHSSNYFTYTESYLQFLLNHKMAKMRQIKEITTKATCIWWL